ncbi:MAG: GDSL-type esterase/lipase family protein [Vogesella sp.]|uniref:GDSL-type esterase/lipase family protein n=1 Tax=Vogesella sp. TaxID=1904252 RepID=UPI00391B5A04
METKTFFAQDTTGAVLGGAQIIVYQAGSQQLATGLTTATGAALANPFTASPTGQVQFAAPDGHYDIRVVSGLRDYTVKNVSFLDVSATRAAVAQMAAQVSQTLSDTEQAMQGLLANTVQQVDQTLATAEDAMTAAKAAAELSMQGALVSANQAVAQAQAARDAAQLSAGVYADTAAGIAAVADGRYFSVPVSGADALILYRRTGATAAEVTRYPSAASVAQLGDRLASVEPVAAVVEKDFTTDPLFLWGVLDQLNRIALALRQDGTLQAKFRDIQMSGASMDASYQTMDEALFCIVDAAGKIGLRLSKDGMLEGKIQSPVEVISARGGRNSLDTRLSQFLTAFGLPRRHAWGEWYLRETRQRLRLRALAEAGQLVVASIGDSWTHSGGRWCGPTAAALKAAFGDAGAGYVSFARNGTTLPNGNVLSNSAVTYAGAGWNTSSYYTNPSADLGSATSATAGDRLSYTIAAGVTAVKLHARGGAGVVRYRFNGGSWAPVDLSALAAQLQVIDLPSPAAGVFDIEVVSGAPVLYGIDVQSSASGVRWHKLGATGSRASQWASADAAQWQSSLQALAPQLVTILLATNDQAGYDASTYKTHMQTIISRVRTALPLADILLIAPCENGRANAYPMAEYAAAAYELAALNKCAFLDLQYVFGDSFSEYASTSARAWFNADLIHPEPATGGRAIADAVIRLITQY